MKKTKKCIVCEKVKPRKDFYTTPLARDGLRSWCKLCWHKGRNLNRWKKAGKILNKYPDSNGTERNPFIPKEKYEYVIVNNPI